MVKHIHNLESFNFILAPKVHGMNEQYNNMEISEVDCQ